DYEQTLVERDEGVREAAARAEDDALAVGDLSLDFAAHAPAQDLDAPDDRLAASVPGKLRKLVQHLGSRAQHPDPFCGLPGESLSLGPCLWSSQGGPGSDGA